MIKFLYQIRKKFLAICLVFILLLQAGCSSKISIPAVAEKSYSVPGVSITDKGNYYDVVLDFTRGLSHKQIGEAYAKGILQLVPDYEALLDSYLSENLIKSEYKYALYRAEDIKPQLNSEYADEIDGMASVFSGGDNDVRGDNKMSKNEMYLFNFSTDALRGTQCCYISVFGSRSKTQKTVTGRNLDWYGGSENQLPRIQAVITYMYPHKKVCSIAFMGYMGILTGFNNNKVFAGVLDSGTNAAYTSEGRRSYVFDLRYALENTDTMDAAAEFMKDSKKLYAYNHLIGFSDPDSSIILENNFSGNGTDGQRVKRAIRKSDSRVNSNMELGVSNAIATVNSFMLYGNNDNYTPNKYNTKRWYNIKAQLNKYGSAVTADNIKSIISFYHGSSPGVFSESGDIYNKMTLQMVLFQPDSLSAEIYFRPKNNRINPLHPVFEKIQAFQ